MRNRFGHKRGQMFGHITIVEIAVAGYTVPVAFWRKGSSYNYGIGDPHYSVPMVV